MEEMGCLWGFERVFGAFWRFARGTLVFFRLKEGLNRRFEACFGAVFGFLETIEFGGG